MATRRDFIQLFAGASLATIVSGRGSWAVAKKLFETDPHAAMKARGLELYNIAGANLFPVYGSDGGLRADQVFYLVNRKTHRALGMNIGVEWNVPGDVAEYAASAVVDACRKFDECSAKVDFDGGAMPPAIRYKHKEIA
jgi:hypothetical protein